MFVGGQYDPFFGVVLSTLRMSANLMSSRSVLVDGVG